MSIYIILAVAVFFFNDSSKWQLYFNIIVEPHARLKRAYYNGVVIDRKQLQQ